MNLEWIETGYSYSYASALYGFLRLSVGWEDGWRVVINGAKRVELKQKFDSEAAAKEAAEIYVHGMIAKYARAAKKEAQP